VVDPGETGTFMGPLPAGYAADISVGQSA